MMNSPQAIIKDKVHNKANAWKYITDLVYLSCLIGATKTNLTFSFSSRSSPIV